jgi:hypothetical protein
MGAQVCITASVCMIDHCYGWEGQEGGGAYAANVYAAPRPAAAGGGPPAGPGGEGGGPCSWQSPTPLTSCLK